MNVREAIRLAVYEHYCTWCEHLGIVPASQMHYEFYSALRWDFS